MIVNSYTCSWRISWRMKDMRVLIVVWCFVIWLILYYINSSQFLNFTNVHIREISNRSTFYESTFVFPEKWKTLECWSNQICVLDSFLAGSVYSTSNCIFLYMQIDHILCLVWSYQSVHFHLPMNSFIFKHQKSIFQ